MGSYKVLIQEKKVHGQRAAESTDIINSSLTLYSLTMMKTILIALALLFSGASALAPSKVSTVKKPAFNVQKAAFSGMAAASIASTLVVGPMADAVVMVAPEFGSSSLVAERVTREGLYKEYDIDVGDQTYDDARSTYKSAKETKTKKGMCECFVLMDDWMIYAN